MKKNLTLCKIERGQLKLCTSHLRTTANTNPSRYKNTDLCWICYNCAKGTDYGAGCGWEMQSNTRHLYRKCSTRWISLEFRGNSMVSISFQPIRLEQALQLGLNV